MGYDFPSCKIIRLTKGLLESALRHFNDYIMKPQHECKQATWAERTNSATVTISHFVNESVLGMSLPFSPASSRLTSHPSSCLTFMSMPWRETRTGYSNKTIKTLMKRHSQAHWMLSFSRKGLQTHSARFLSQETIHIQLAVLIFSWRWLSPSTNITRYVTVNSTAT